MTEIKQLVNSLISFPQYLLKDEKIGYFVIKGRIGNRAVLLKVVAKTAKDKLDKLLYEKIAESFLLDSEGDPIFRFPREVGQGENEHYVWLIRQFLTGESLAGYSDRTKSLMGYDVIKNKFICSGAQVVDEIAESLNKLWSLPVNQESKNKLSSGRFAKSIESYDIKAIEKGIGQNLGKQLKFYCAIKKRLFSKDNEKMCLGDLTPSNIIIGYDGHIILSDFELFCVDNYFVDVVFLWLFLWRYPDWQKLILERFVKTQDNRDFFRANLIREIIAWYDYKFNPKTESGSTKEIWAKHRWSDYLLYAGISYEEIIKNIGQQK